MHTHEMQSAPNLQNAQGSLLQESQFQNAIEASVLQAAAAKTDPFLQIGSAPHTTSSAVKSFHSAYRASEARRILQLQRSHGNRYVQRLLSSARGQQEGNEVSPDVQSSIEQKRGGGNALDQGLRQDMESKFDFDFRDVRVHTDTEAATLNRAVSAVAFTTGKDIFFSNGSYSPGTSEGRQLLAHELTHVVQQGGSTVQRRLVLGEPNDQYEQEAEAAAKQIDRAASTAGREEPGAMNTIQRFKGSKDFVEYDLDGHIEGGAGDLLPPSLDVTYTEITGENVTMPIVADTSGELTLSLEGRAVGRISGFWAGGIAFAEFGLDSQKIPYRCTADGVLTLDSAGMLPGHATIDAFHPNNPIGANLGVSIVASTDGSKYLMELISFTASGGGISVGLSKGPVGVSGPTMGAASPESTAVRLRINFVVGRHKAPSPTQTPAAPAPAPVATATGGATAIIMMGEPAHATSRSLGEVYFANEGDVTADTKLLYDIVAKLSPEAQREIRLGHSQLTVHGFASTTGTEESNMDHYSKERAEWAQKYLAALLGLAPDNVKPGWQGSYGAPPEQQPKVHRGGVPDWHQRRVEILLDETTLASPGSVIVHSSSSATASH